MNFLPLIEAKRDGERLSELQIQAAVAAYTRGEIPDYQMSAWLMAVYFRGLDTGETRALTLAMQSSGETLRFPDDTRPLADKHSTGGVGDKISLPLAPLLACLGLRVPMISGRGLGITGGTLDKLESIPGFQTQLSPERIVHQVQQIGCCICGQTAQMTPADRALYALRDVTGTVPSIPLITASILSKKLSENLDALLLDVKFGSAAFMQTVDEARKLARAMVDLGNECGVKTRALLTGMDEPLGDAAGNWLEVVESHECLKGGSKASSRGIGPLVVECAAHLLVQTDLVPSVAEGRQKAADCLDSGEAYRKWEQMLQWQGADLGAYWEKIAEKRTAPVVRDLLAPRGGFITRCNARIVGEVVRDLGGGRLTKDAILLPEVGVDGLAKLGDWISNKALLCRVHATSEAQAENALTRLLGAFRIEDQAPGMPPLIAEIME